MMVEAASRRNKRAGARSPSWQGHLWWRRRTDGQVSSQICGSGEGWSPRVWSIFDLAVGFVESVLESEESADDVVFPLAGRGGEGEKGDGTTALLFRVMCALLVVCGCSILQLPPTGLGGGRRLDVSTSKPARWWSVLLRLGSTALGSSSRGTASSSPSPTRPMVWKKKK
jgi:hypothetical protein